tara:strand:+ start:19 stop:648 length:630 start_codon:yes stop_codon:yes gene_type:complete
MYALVEDNEIKKIITNPKQMIIDDVQYSSKIFQLWSESELNAIGIYEVVTDSSNFKNEKWYINTNESYVFADNQVTRSWGTATPKAHADSLWTQEDEDENEIPSDKNVGDVKVEGLKTTLIKGIKNKADNILKQTDWYIIRNADTGEDIPSTITNHRSAVRTKCAEMEASITNANDTLALEILYTEVNTGTEQNPVWERPIGHLPTYEG